MNIVRLQNRHKIAEYLEKDPWLHIYGLGDLEDPLWDRTAWYGFKKGENLEVLFYIYQGPDSPALLAFSREIEPLASLLREAMPVLPLRFEAHLIPGLKEVFQAPWIIESEKPHYRMALPDVRAIEKIDTGNVIRLEVRHLKQLQALYDKSYPDNWFDPKIFRQNIYFGIMKDRRLVSAAGTHVLSAQYRAAALGNIATLPEYRNRGYAAAVTAALSQSLHGQGIRTGLNVRADNIPALVCYKKTGFKIVAEYSECAVSRRQAGMR